MSTIDPQFLTSIPSVATYDNHELNRKFEVYAHDQTLYQSESEVSPGGEEKFHATQQMKWIIGAGVNGFGAILEKNSYLFQAPLSFYSRTKTWEPSPGYALADLGFNRPITPGCIFCHSGRPNAVPDRTGLFETPAFSELSIGCENCHGPGAIHIQSVHGAGPAGKAGASLKEANGIVNPARLTPYLADNICMACHQTGDVRVLKPGKAYGDFRPGEPLDKTLSIFIVPPVRESPPSVDHVEHYYSMTLSKCYRASQGRLSCITCHDPHVEPTEQQAPAYYNSKCLSCHTDQSCKLSVAARKERTPADNCIGCHMPKRDIQVISHSSATNHRIVARPDEPFPDITFEQTTAALPDLIHLNPAHLSEPGKGAGPPPSLTLLQAYGELAENRPEYVASYLNVLGDLEKTQPDDPLVQAALGRKDLKSGDYTGAANHLRRALASHPDVATTYADLAEALGHLGQTMEAISLLHKSIELDPFNPLPRKMLVVQLVQTKNYAEAHLALKDYLDVFPQDDFMRQMLDKAEGRNTHP